jgi:hypothetical protein
MGKISKRNPTQKPKKEKKHATLQKKSKREKEELLFG